MKSSRLLAAVAVTALAALAPSVAQAASFQFGSGKFPDITMDQAGVAHVVWDENVSGGDDPLHYCRLPRGASACQGDQVLHPPGEAIGRASYVFAPSPGRIVIVTDRAGTDDVLAYESADGGVSFGPVHQIGDFSFDQNAVFGPGNAITASSQGAVQTMPLSGPPATTHADLDPGFFAPTFGSVAVSGSDIVHVAADGDNSSFNRYTGGDPNAAGSWTPASKMGPANDTRMAGGPKGIVLFERLGTPGEFRMVARKFDGSGFGDAVTVSETGDPIESDIYADPASGLFFATWVDNRTPNELRYATSPDGVSWSAPIALLQENDLDTFHLQIAGSPDGKGFVVADQNATPNSKLRAVPLEKLPTAGTGGSSSGVNGGAGEAPVASVTVAGQTITLLAPRRCVKSGTKIRLRVTHKQKVKLSPRRRVKIKTVVFNLDRKKKTDKKAAFRKDFSTKGFKAASKHRVGARITLRPVKGRSKFKAATLKGGFKICP